MEDVHKSASIHGGHSNVSATMVMKWTKMERDVIVSYLICVPNLYPHNLDFTNIKMFFFYRSE